MTPAPPPSVLTVSVRDLVEFSYRTGDIDASTFSRHTALDAIRAHQRIQQSRPEGYRAEVPISYEHQTGEFVLKIQGRMDGLFETDGRVVIDEIKTTALDLDSVLRERDPMHWSQVTCYVALYAEQHDVASIDVQVTYYNVLTNKTAEQRETMPRSELREFLDSLITRYLPWATMQYRWLERRDASCAALSFPFPTFRPEQRRIAASVFRAVRGGQRLLIQAPTGTGKTCAVLFPALKALGLHHCMRIFFLTARTTGKEAAASALAQMRSTGLKLKSLVLTAKRTTCFNPDTECSPLECRYARGHFARVNDALQSVFASDDCWDRACVERVAHEYTLCPFEFSLELSQYADCVCADYNYAFDPRVMLERHFGGESTGNVVLVDEAHNLVDRGRDMYSAELQLQSFINTRPALGRSLKRLRSSISAVEDEMRRLLDGDAESEVIRCHNGLPEILVQRVTEFCTRARAWLVKNLRRSFRKTLLETYFEAMFFLRIAMEYDQRYTTCYDASSENATLRLVCLDASRFLREKHQHCSSAVFFSATLIPMAYIKQTLGIPRDARQMIAPCPFPRENRLVVSVSSISTLYKQRQETKHRIAELLGACVRERPGKYLFFFPSYTYCEMIVEAFRSSITGIEIVVQDRGQGDLERREFLSHFTHGSDSAVQAGFAVLGGSFAESIDLPGGCLDGCAIIGVGLPGISPVRNALRSFYQNACEDGFGYAYQYPGMTRVVQAAGRLIRSESDRGVILLIDQRYGTPRYRRLLPPEWEVTPAATSDELDRLMKVFDGKG